MKDFFKPKDFERPVQCVGGSFAATQAAALEEHKEAYRAAEIANAKLNAFLQCQQKLYGDSRLGNYHGAPILWSIDEKSESTHSCRIVDIEQLGPR